MELCFFFFFQAEDGIRDDLVTGVQTCALPIWATTSAGRIFVTHNADATDPATVTWHRIDNATSPTRFPSSVYPDINNTGHAWITYSGYNASTPTTPGHVFDVKENGTAPGSGQFTNLDLES